ncbi:hypothetical protein N9R79_06580 [Vibrio sp.]|nr:hypothetical protein [Vibrio sp.]
MTNNSLSHRYVWVIDMGLKKGADEWPCYLRIFIWTPLALSQICVNPLFNKTDSITNNSAKEDTQ